MIINVFLAISILKIIVSLTEISEACYRQVPRAIKLDKMFTVQTKWTGV